MGATTWQHERAARLHFICQLIKQRVAKGHALLKAIRIFSRRWNHKSFRSDPRHRFALSVSTLYRHWRSWRLAGEVRSAFRLNYFSRRYIPAPVLVRFVELCARQKFPSLGAACRAFCRRRGNHGPGRVKLGYAALCWNLPRGSFAELKRQQKAVSQARRQIEILRLKFTAAIRARVPDRLPRQRMKPEGDFQI